MVVRLMIALMLAASAGVVSNAQQNNGGSVFGGWRGDTPGKRYHITPGDLPAPSRPGSNRTDIIRKPEKAELKVPTGFEANQFAAGLRGPRIIRVAPNGDIFVAESRDGRILVLRPSADGTSAEQRQVFTSGLNRPFGIAFYPADNPQWVYVANTDSVVRFAYRADEMKAQGRPQHIAKLPSGGGHWTRDIVFSKDGTRMFVSVGSGSNVAEDMRKLPPAALRKWKEEKPLGATWGSETDRADVLVFDPDGKNKRIYATGIRNCVGMAINPTTGDLWCSTNERDMLGDNLVPDYITRVKEGAFYGWPWYYIGSHQDPRHAGERPDLKDKVTVPDILIQPHSASLGMMFYTGDQFPAEYKGNIFAAEHGSWNRSTRTGYKVIRAIVKDGVPEGTYQDFVVGFVVNDSAVWGRPVGVAEAKDGSLLFSEDGNGTIWRVTSTARASGQ